MRTVAARGAFLGPWVIKVRKTGCRVGVLRLAVEHGKTAVKIVRMPAGLLRGSAAPSTEVITLDLDRDKGEAWVDRADALCGMDGYEPD